MSYAWDSRSSISTNPFPYYFIIIIMTHRYKNEIRLDVGRGAGLEQGWLRNWRSPRTGRKCHIAGQS